jgi:uncharacterized protein (UPF0335 family)
MLKIKNPQEVEEEFKNVADKLGLGIDKNIFRSVVILNSLGYKTRQSCEGHLERYSTKPWIDFVWDEENTEEYFNKNLNFIYQNLFQDLKEFYQNRKGVPFDQRIILDIINNKEGKLWIVLSQNDNSKCFEGKREEKLKNYLQEINDFCEFLNKKYRLNY